MPRRPRLQHVSVPRPPGSQPQTRAFYGELLGLAEMSPPAALSHLDLVWYRLADTELHLYVGPLASPDSGQHLCIEVDDVAALRGRVEAAGHLTQGADEIPGRPRFFTRDPFGNLLEFTTLEEG